jgi:SRSO17 transposase
MRPAKRKGTATAGAKRQHMGCAGGIDNGIITVHASVPGTR